MSKFRFLKNHWWAILAIDGDYYGAREGGYVIRNGVLYRSTMNTSATMVFNGSVVNNPTSDGVTFRERRVTDIVYIGY